jgi:hypothetical protein
VSVHVGEHSTHPETVTLYNKTQYRSFHKLKHALFPVLIWCFFMPYDFSLLLKATERISKASSSAS